MKGFEIDAFMLPPTIKRDQSLTLKFATREVGRDEAANLMRYINQPGWVLFSENELKEEDIPKQDADIGNKTPSQRLRATLWVFHQQQRGKPEEFDGFYRKQMERFIRATKDKLE